MSRGLLTRSSIDRVRAPILWWRRARRQLGRWVWSPVRLVCRRFDRVRRTAAWVRMHRRALTFLFVVLAHSLGIASSIKVLNENRTPQGAIAWIVSLNTFPYVAVPVYWAIGETNYEDYALAFRERRAEGAPILDRLRADLESKGLTVEPSDDTQQLLERLGNLPITRGNEVELLVDGRETFESIFQSIQAARSYVLIEFYILRDDELGERLKQMLLAKVRQGVSVRVLYDVYGSHGLSSDYVRDLREGGVEVAGFNPPLDDVSTTRINFRNHRKLVVVDGIEAFVGGHNVGNEYLVGFPNEAPYRDTHVSVRGPLAISNQVVFAEDWFAATDELLVDLNWTAVESPNEDVVALCLPTGPADEFETASMFFLHLINRARDRVWIATPYFVPDKQMTTALQLAALRGVDVRVLIPSKSDSRLVELSSHSYLPEMEAAGVKMFRYRGPFLHQKVMLVDDDLATVGTANFDNRSFRLNFELMLVFFDQSFNREVAEMLQVDFERSDPAPGSELTDRSTAFRLLSRAARLLAPIQ